MCAKDRPLGPYTAGLGLGFEVPQTVHTHAREAWGLTGTHRLNTRKIEGRSVLPSTYLHLWLTGALPPRGGRSVAPALVDGSDRLLIGAARAVRVQNAGGISISIATEPARATQAGIARYFHRCQHILRPSITFLAAHIVLFAIFTFWRSRFAAVLRFVG
jgi:hypothetical protein